MDETVPGGKPQLRILEFQPYLSRYPQRSHDRKKPTRLNESQTVVVLCIPSHLLTLFRAELLSDGVVIAVFRFGIFLESLILSCDGYKASVVRRLFRIAGGFLAYSRSLGVVPARWPFKSRQSCCFMDVHDEVLLAGRRRMMKRIFRGRGKCPSLPESVTTFQNSPLPQKPQARKMPNGKST